MRFKTREPEYVESLVRVLGLKNGFGRVSGNLGLGPSGPGKPGLRTGTGTDDEGQN